MMILLTLLVSILAVISIVSCAIDAPAAAVLSISCIRTVFMCEIHYWTRTFGAILWMEAILYLLAAVQYRLYHHALFLSRIALRVLQLLYMARYFTIQAGYVFVLQITIMIMFYTDRFATIHIVPDLRYYVLNNWALVLDHIIRT